MIKLTLKEVVPMAESLDNIMNLPIPAKQSYRLGVLAKFIQERMSVYEKSRQNLVQKYGEKTDNVIRVKSENINQFSEEMESLLSEEVQIDFQPISVSSLEEVKISPKDMAILSVLFRE